MKWVQQWPTWNGQTVVRLWLQFWRGQAEDGEDQVAREVWGKCAALLSALQKKHGMEWDEVADFVLWYWLWKVPEWQAREGGSEPRAPDPRPLFGCVKQWRYWRDTRAGVIAQVGLIDACRLELPEPEETAWTKPAGWRTLPGHQSQPVPLTSVS